MALDSAENQSVTWKSEKTCIATVDAEGTAVITVTTDDGAKVATCTVTVSKPRPMTMNTTMKSTVDIRLAGFGTAVIRWGNGYIPIMVTFSTTITEYIHTFSSTTSRTIAIDGPNITTSGL